MLHPAFTTRCRLTAVVRFNSLTSTLLPASRSVLPRQAVLSCCSFFVRTLKTFIPFAGCTPEEGVLRSLIALDDKRLGKQRVESQQAPRHCITAAALHEHFVRSLFLSDPLVWCRTVQRIRFGRWCAVCRSTTLSGRPTMSHSSRPLGPNTRQSTCGWGQRHQHSPAPCLLDA